MGVRSTWLVAMAVGAAGCGAAGCGHRSAPPDATPAIASAGSDGTGSAAPAAPIVPDFPDGTQSLRMIRSGPVRLTPGEDGKQIGTIAQDTRVAWTRSAKAPGCRASWVEIAPRGWVCADRVKPSDKPPTGVELPRLDPDGLVPGTYGKVVEDGAVTYRLETADELAKKQAEAAKKAKKPPKRKKGDPPEPPPAPPIIADEPTAQALPFDPSGRRMIAGEPLLGSVNVRKYAETDVGDKTYWKIDPKKNQWLLAKTIHQHTPSAWHGTRLGDDTGLALPIAFVFPRWDAPRVTTHGKAQGGGIVQQLAARTAVPVLETFADAKSGKPVAYRIGDGEWIDAPDAKLVTAATPPELIQPGERWFDVDVDAETLVAYEGDTAVYATLVSSGAKATPTETGLYRIWKKVAETDMRGLSGGGEDPYSVATVPWTEFFSPEKGLALHTAYWHDGFGHPKSHGCVNLAPIDARWLYFWSDPWMPPGWTMTAGVVEAPGSIVRVRSAADPSPPWKGYAIRVQEARQAAQPPAP
jgi:hypothetical protein